MPSQAKRNAAEEVHRLREENKKKDALIAKLQRQAEEAATAAKKTPLKPRPEGQAGHSSGCNLMEEMGLSKNSERYNRLYRIVKDYTNEYLSVHNTISKQDKKRLDKTICIIAEKFTFFQQFEGFWPVHDMIASYLLNMQTRRRKDYKLEQKAEALDKKDTASNTDNDSDADDVDVTPRPSLKRKKPLRIDSDDEDDPSDDDKIAGAKGKNTVQKRKPTEALVDEPPPKKVKFEPKPKAVATTPHKSKPAPPLSWSDLPRGCPTVLCDDDLPETPSRRILSLYNQRQTLIQKVGRSGPGVKFLELQICDAITNEGKWEQYRALGRKRGWPETIDYASVPNRILAFCEEFVQMIKDENTLEESPIWQAFLRSIDHKIFSFSKSKSKMNFTYALYEKHCGYYGPKGEFIINSTIIRALSEDDDELSYALYSTIHSLIIKNEELFDPYDAESELIELKDFISFILTPFAAALLIAEDRELDFVNADDVRNDSNPFGDIMQPEDVNDDLLDELHRKNIKAMNGSNNVFFSQPPPRQRKHKVDDAEDDSPSDKNKPKTEPVRPKAKAKAGTLSVEDFIEPEPKGRKSKASKKEAEKKEKAASKIAKNPVQSDYGTRAKTRAARN